MIYPTATFTFRGVPEPKIERPPLPPPGQHYVLRITKVDRYVSPRDLETMRVEFAVAVGPHTGKVTWMFYLFGPDCYAPADLLRACGVGGLSEEWVTVRTSDLVGKTVIADIEAEEVGYIGQVHVANIRESL